MRETILMIFLPFAVIVPTVCGQPAAPARRSLIENGAVTYGILASAEYSDRTRALVMARYGDSPGRNAASCDNGPNPL